MRAVDTNIVVRLIARDDAVQTSHAETFVADGAWVSCLVLAESVWVLESVYGLGKQQLASTVAMLLEHIQIVLQDADAVRAALEAFESHGGVSFTDCLVAAIAHKNGHRPVGTFDRKLAKINGVEGLG